MTFFAPISLTDDEPAALEDSCRHRKVKALVWKWARAFILVDSKEEPGTICRTLDIGPTVLMEWRCTYSAEGLAFFGLKDCSQREGHLSFAQDEALKKHFTEHPPRNAAEVCGYTLAEYGQNYSASGAAKFMHDWVSCTIGSSRFRRRLMRLCSKHLS